MRHMTTTYGTFFSEMKLTAKKTNLLKLFTKFLIFAVLTLVCVLLVQKIFFQQPTVETVAEEPIEIPELSVQLSPADFQKTAVNFAKEADKGLLFYRDEATRDSVIWFYSHIVESENIASVILENADKNDIPVALAFSLAYVESRYKPRAINRNKNKSIDRGLFQLNNRTFPDLEENDFFDPAINAKMGLSHLRFCLDTAGNEITALAMYNAGTTKVKRGETPKVTLDYVSKIMSYRSGLESLFAQEVIAKAPTQETPILVATTKE